MSIVDANGKTSAEVAAEEAALDWRGWVVGYVSETMPAPGALLKSGYMGKRRTAENSEPGMLSLENAIEVQNTMIPQREGSTTRSIQGFPIDFTAHGRVSFRPVTLIVLDGLVASDLGVYITARRMAADALKSMTRGAPLIRPANVMPIGRP